MSLLLKKKCCCGADCCSCCWLVLVELFNSGGGASIDGENNVLLARDGCRFTSQWFYGHERYVLERIGGVWTLTLTDSMGRKFVAEVTSVTGADPEDIHCLWGDCSEGVIQNFTINWSITTNELPGSVSITAATCQSCEGTDDADCKRCEPCCLHINTLAAVEWVIDATVTGHAARTQSGSVANLVMDTLTPGFFSGTFTVDGHEYTIWAQRTCGSLIWQVDIYHIDPVNFDVTHLWRFAATGDCCGASGMTLSATGAGYTEDSTATATTAAVTLSGNTCCKDGCSRSCVEGGTEDCATGECQ